MSRPATKKEKEWMQAIRPLGCIVCILTLRIRPFTVPEEYTAIHHIDGQTKPGAHFLTIPLCPHHHQTGEDALHKNKTRFEEKFGTEQDLLNLTKEYIA
jgi:hypothetical protein